MKAARDEHGITHGCWRVTPGWWARWCAQSNTEPTHKEDQLFDGPVTCLLCWHWLPTVEDALAQWPDKL